MQSNLEVASPEAGGGRPHRALSSNNPYRKRVSEQQQEQQNPFSDESQSGTSDIWAKMDDTPMVVEQEDLAAKPQSGYDPANAPMVVEQERRAANLNPDRNTFPEVVSSWQTQSREENAPISMEYHESNMPPPSESSNSWIDDKKGPPPSYDSVGERANKETGAITSQVPLRQDSDSRSGRNEDLSPSLSIEPDGQPFLPPRPEDRSAVDHLLGWIPKSSQLPQAEKRKPLSRPVVIPQLDVPPKGESVSFVRCYSDDLATHGISLREFVAFLDGLAVAQAHSSMMQGLKAFGVVASHVPLPFIPLAGRGISALANSTSGSGHSGSRARLYLSRANKEYFGPRGLRLDIVRDDAIAQRLGIPQSTSGLAPLTRDTLTSNICERRFAALAPYAAPLRYNVPDPDKDIGAIEKMIMKEQQHRMRKNAKDLAELREKQWQAQEFGRGKGIDAVMEEEKLARRLKWLVISVADY